MSISPYKYTISYYENLFSFKEKIDKRRLDAGESKMVERIWQRDHTVWDEDPDEISNRLGWLDSPLSMRDRLDEINGFAEQVLKEGFRNVVILGMGGSSLSCELFGSLFSDSKEHPQLFILDTTHPDTIYRLRKGLDPLETLVIVSTKSGTTLETISLMRYFYRNFVDQLGKQAAGNHFVAITDPGTNLEKISSDLNFRKIFINDPNIGGRFSVLSFFGLVPAALRGVDLEELLTSALFVSEISKLDDTSSENGNMPARLGISIGVLAGMGVNRMHVVTSEELYTFNDWLEQLVAESTGKRGKSVLPVFGKSIKDDFNYGEDSFFLFVGFEDDIIIDSDMKKALNKKIPVISLRIRDKYAAGGLFFLWEFAVSVTGAAMGINPFDQPNVEETKVQTKKLVESYTGSGAFDQVDRDFVQDGITFYDRYSFGNIENFSSWLKGLADEDRKRYLCLQLFLDTNDQNKLWAWRLKDILENKLQIPVTVGFGPRYLHSTGQLHKGDSGEGIFMQVISNFQNDINIPDGLETDSSSITFGVLISAQSLGDYIALREITRDTVRVDLGGEDLETLVSVTDLI